MSFGPALSSLGTNLRIQKAAVPSNAADVWGRGVKDSVLLWGSG